MANKPVLGTAVCPYCGSKVPVIWNGNFKILCVYCGKKFHVKRQKLKNIQPLPRRAFNGRNSNEAEN